MVFCIRCTPCLVTSGCRSRIWLQVSACSSRFSGSVVEKIISLICRRFWFCDYLTKVLFICFNQPSNPVDQDFCVWQAEYNPYVNNCGLIW